MEKVTDYIRSATISQYIIFLLKKIQGLLIILFLYLKRL